MPHEVNGELLAVAPPGLRPALPLETEPDATPLASGQRPAKFPPPAAVEGDMQSLSWHYARTRDPQARDQLILHHQKLVHYVAARFIGSGETLEDLVQVGTIGLINALDRYDPGQNVKFSTYAMPTIVGEIKRHFRDKTWHVKVPRWLQELSLSARKAQQTLSARLGRPRRSRRSRRRSGRPRRTRSRRWRSARPRAPCRWTRRLDPQAGGDSATLMDLIGKLDSALHDIEAYADLRRALELLDARERQVIHLRFFDELSQAKIARKLNISQMHVSRLQQRALQRLHDILADDGLAARSASAHTLPAGRTARPRTEATTP